MPRSTLFMLAKLLALAFILGYAAKVARAQGEFGSPSIYPPGGHFNVIGDYNNDGFPDVAAINPGGSLGSPGSFGIYMNQGNGTLGKVFATYPVGLSPTGAIAGDFNNDGNLDIVVANSASTFASVALGRGDGTFYRGQNISTSFDPISVVSGDFNGDGNLDIAVISDPKKGNNLKVGLGKGDGTFSSAGGYRAGKNPNAIAAGDFNLDGKLDLVVTDWANEYTVLLGNGDGTFQSPMTVAFGNQPHAVAVADFNGDGVPDLAIAQHAEISILFGNGDGTFRAGEAILPGVTPGTMAVADFNRDGYLDFVIDYSSNSVMVILGGPNGTFGTGTRYSTEDGSVTSQVSVGDFNLDGFPDLCVAEDLGIAILLNTGQ